MLTVYMILTAVHIVALVVTGILWTTIILKPQARYEPTFVIFVPCTSARSI